MEDIMAGRDVDIAGDHVRPKEGREMSLLEWSERLPMHHRVNREFNKLREAIGFFNSMIRSGENHSPQSEKVFEEARHILTGL